jgi:cytochrome c553
VRGLPHDRRQGGKVGPELGRAHHISLTQFAGLMWNHAPAMSARMKDRRIEVPQLTGQEMADIVAYLYTSHYFDPAAGSSVRGRQVVQTKGCVDCHSVRGRGKVAADFATSNVVGSPAALIAAMWNHSRAMEDQATKQGIKLPTLKGQELADLSAYLRSLTRPARRARRNSSNRGDSQAFVLGNTASDAESPGLCSAGVRPGRWPVSSRSCGPMTIGKDPSGGGLISPLVGTEHSSARPCTTSPYSQSLELPEGKSDRSQPVSYPEFRKDIVGVIADGGWADVQSIGEHSIRGAGD